MENGEWNMIFPGSVVEFQSPGVANHCLSLLQGSDVVQQPRKPFKFFNFWFQHLEFLDKVKEGWQAEVRGNPMQVLHKKLKLLKPLLREFNKKHFPNIYERVVKLRERLDQVQKNILIASSAAKIEEERSLQVELLEMRKAEESFYKQKSRVQWLQEGDLNTKFFHGMLKTKQKKKQISRLQDQNGNMLCT